MPEGIRMLGPAKTGISPQESLWLFLSQFQHQEWTEEKAGKDQRASFVRKRHVSSAPSLAPLLHSISGHKLGPEVSLSQPSEASLQ